MTQEPPENGQGDEESAAAKLEGGKRPTPPLARRLRNYLIAGVLVTAPITLTVWLVWRFISFVDGQIRPLIPPRLQPHALIDRYLDLPFSMPIDIPGIGVLTALIGLIVIGYLGAGYLGRVLMGYGERLLARVPIARSIYGAVKQVMETVLASQSAAFREVVLVEYPRQDSWAIGFITGETKGEVQRVTDETTINVFIPATPNPTTGFLLFLPRDEVHTLDISVEDGIKLVVSGGIVTPPKNRKEAAALGDEPAEEEPRPALGMPVKPPPRPGFFGRLRNYMLTGLLVTVPFGITAWVGWEFISFIDSRIKPLLPRAWDPDTYLPFSVPGIGVLALLVFLILIGMFAAGLVGRFLMRTGERMVARVPVVRSVYSWIKQIFETVLAQKSNAFREVMLFEYPRRGSWSIGFLTGQTEGHVQDLTDRDVLNIFLPTTPNPTSGFLLFVPREDAIPLSMTVEQGLKMVISGGIITPPDPAAPETDDEAATIPSSAASRRS